MALSILDGTTAAFDITFSALSWKCKANYVTARITRRFYDQTTFCSGFGWVAEIPGMKQLFGHMEGFVGKGGNEGDNPLYLFQSNNSVASVITYDTGCTLTSSIFADTSESGIRAGQNSNMVLDWRSTGAVTSAWITS